MRYRYIFAARIQGLIAPETDVVVEVSRVSGTITYTGDCEAIPQVVDLRSAIGSLMLGGLAGRGPGDVKIERDQAVSKIRQARVSEKSGNSLVIVDINSQIEDFELAHTREEDDFIVCLGDSPAKSIRSSHERYIQSLLAAISIASPHDVLAKRLAESVVFYTDGGKPIFCYEMEAYGTAYSAVPLTNSLAEDAGQFALQLSRGPDYNDVNRLIAKSLDMASDELLSFLSAWNSLEIFLNRAFKDYEKSIFAGSGDGQAGAHHEVVGRIKKVMSDKFRISDKFAVIAGDLDPANAAGDLKTFLDVKQRRDGLLHGKEMVARNLPSETGRKLVRKYLRLHLERAARST